MFSIFKPYIFSLDPEVAHDLAIKSLKFNLLPKSIFNVKDEECLETHLLNEKIPNPIGLAAGFDKSAEVYNEIFKIGFGFVEIGTVTPKKQYGNQKPRVFRLEKDQALINRLGFNNDGSDTVKKRIENNVPDGLLGINIGPNKDTDNMYNDFLECAEAFFPLGDYVTINISSPNTVGLRDFHKEESLKELLLKINDLRKKSNFKKSFLLKISPDLEQSSINKIIDLSLFLSEVLVNIIPLMLFFNDKSTILFIEESSRSGEIFNKKDFLKLLSFLISFILIRSFSRFSFSWKFLNPSVFGEEIFIVM